MPSTGMRAYSPAPRRMARPAGIDRRYGRQLREAVLRSTGAELLAIEALDTAYRRGDLSVFDASDRLRRMLAQQHQRDQQAAA